MEEYQEAIKTMDKSFLMTPEHQKMFLNEIKTDHGTISAEKLSTLIDVYQFVPLTIKRDRNKSNDIYMVVNSN